MTLALAAGVIALYSSGMRHAIDRHGEDAFTVSHCLSENGALQIWFNPDTRRHAEVCQIDPGRFGIRISVNDLKDTITQFVKNKMTRIERVEQYLINRGYIRIQ
jgi:hypothetical protein